MTAEHWEFRPDGSGRALDTGPFGNPQREARFEWRQVGDFELQWRITERIAHESDFATELDDEDREWRTTRYDFVVVRHDCGAEIGLTGLSLFEPLSYDNPTAYDVSECHPTDGDRCVRP